jgi:hypothetical protein
MMEEDWANVLQVCGLALSRRWPDRLSCSDVFHRGARSCLGSGRKTGKILRARLLPGWYSTKIRLKTDFGALPIDELAFAQPHDEWDILA